MRRFRNTGVGKSEFSRKAGKMKQTTEERNPTDRLLHGNWSLLHAARKGGIGAIIDAAGEIFDCPVIFADTDFRLLTCCPTGASEYAFWNRLQQERCLDVRIMMQILNENVSNVRNFYEPFYAKDGLCSEHPVLMGEVLYHQTVYGHVLVCLDQHPLQEDDLEMVSLLISILEMSLNKREENMDHWNRAMTTRLQDLLVLDTPRHLVDLAVDTLSRNLTGRFAVMVTPFGQQASQQAFAHLAVMRLQQTYQNIVTLIYENAIVTLFGGVKYTTEHPILRPDNNFLAGKLFQFFEKYNMKCGLSNSFQDLRFTRMFYHQALYAAELAVSQNPERPAVFMDQMPLPLFFSLLKYEPGRVFLHPVIFQIRAYDRKHGTEYEKTLRTYVLCMKNREEAAEKLSIHKNTLGYRLSRIMDIFDLPLEDSRTSLNLLCTALMLEIDDSLGDRKPPHEK